MFRNVPECSGMFRNVPFPGFIDGPKYTRLEPKTKLSTIKNYGHSPVNVSGVKSWTS